MAEEKIVYGWELSNTNKGPQATDSRSTVKPRHDKNKENQYIISDENQNQKISKASRE